jgi:hypothetical protein
MPKTEANLAFHGDPPFLLPMYRQNAINDIERHEDQRALDYLNDAARTHVGVDMALGRDRTVVTLFGRPASQAQVNRYQDLRSRLDQVQQSLSERMSGFIGMRADRSTMEAMRVQLAQEMQRLRSELDDSSQWRSQYVLGSFDPERDHEYGPAPRERSRHDVEVLRQLVESQILTQEQVADMMSIQGVPIDPDETAVMKQPEATLAPALAKAPVTSPDFKPGRVLDLPAE